MIVKQSREHQKRRLTVIVHLGRNVKESRSGKTVNHARAAVKASDERVPRLRGPDRQGPIRSGFLRRFQRALPAVYRGTMTSALALAVAPRASLAEYLTR